MLLQHFCRRVLLLNPARYDPQSQVCCGVILYYILKNQAHVSYMGGFPGLTHTCPLVSLPSKSPCVSSLTYLRVQWHGLEDCRNQFSSVKHAYSCSYFYRSPDLLLWEICIPTPPLIPGAGVECLGQVFPTPPPPAFFFFKE